MEEVRIQVADLDVKKYAAALMKDKPETLIAYGRAMAAAMTAYFLNDAVCIKAEKDQTQYAACIRIFLDKMKLPVPQQIGYNFFIDGIMTQNTEVKTVVSQRLTEFTMLVDVKLKGMGYGVKWVPPTGKTPPTEVVSSMTFDDICTLFL